jgi:hypothetical protein
MRFVSPDAALPNVLYLLQLLLMVRRRQATHAAIKSADDSLVPKNSAVLNQ